MSRWQVSNMWMSVGILHIRRKYIVDGTFAVRITIPLMPELGTCSYSAAL
jgi:hypothetical protein